MKLRAEVDGRTVSVEGEDVLAWRGLEPGDEREAVALARASAADYVRAHPRPDPDAQGGYNVPARQRLALLRRLAAGPATKRELLEAMRRAAGYVGGDDWRNRLDELRGHGKRGGGHLPLPIVYDPKQGTYRLVESFADLPPAMREAAAAAKAALDLLGPATLEARGALDALLPDIGPDPGTELAPPATPLLVALEQARRRRTAVRVTTPQGTHPVVVHAVLPGPRGPRLYLGALTDDGQRRGGWTVGREDITAAAPCEDITPAAAVFDLPRRPLRLVCDPAVAASLRASPPAGVRVDRVRTVRGGVQLEGSFNPELATEVATALAELPPRTIVSPRWLAAGIALRAARMFAASGAAGPDSEAELEQAARPPAGTPGPLFGWPL